MVSSVLRCLSIDVMFLLSDVLGVAFLINFSSPIFISIAFNDRSSSLMVYLGSSGVPLCRKLLLLNANFHDLSNQVLVTLFLVHAFYSWPEVNNNNVKISSRQMPFLGLKCLQQKRKNTKFTEITKIDNLKTIPKWTKNIYSKKFV